jgi:hypothetical protein
MIALPPEVLRASILDACRSPKLFKPWFRDPKTWASWFCFLKVLFGLKLNAEELDLFRRCTGRDQPRPEGYLEAWLICGRRAGKSFVIALTVVFLACFRSWAEFLAPGERGTIMVVAADRRQARVIHRYCRALLMRVPALTQLVQRDVAEVIDLTNGISIEILTASFRTIRGYSVVAACCDEICYWKSDLSISPDTEVINALKPAMSTVRGAMFLAASSPYARRGIAWRAYQRNWAKDTATLVWQADTRTMNPTVPQSVIDDAQEEDPAAAAAEYLAQWRVDVEGFVMREVVEACTVLGRYEQPYVSGTVFAGFCDLAGGGGGDSMSLAVGHYDRDAKLAVLDALREVRPPCSPSETVAGFAQLLKSYGVHRVCGDRYAGEWPREEFREHGIEYEPAANAKSDYYRELLPLLNSRRVELLDSPRLMAQLVNLERRVARGGRDSVDHGPGGHDDLANAVAGLVVRLMGDAQDAGQWLAIARNFFGLGEPLADPPPPPPPVVVEVVS